MKKILTILVCALMATTVSFAQTAQELAKEQKSLNEILRKSLDAKPTKDAKKQAKQFKKEGWTVPAGELSIEKQLTRSQLLSAELTTDDNGNTTNRFMQHTAQSTAGTYNAAFAAARTSAQTELAAIIETELAAAMELALDNDQANAISATTNDRFHERVRNIVHQSLTGAVPVVTIYRRLPNNNFEVQVRLAYDKKEVAKRIKAQLKKELKDEGDELFDVLPVLNGIY